MLFFIGLALGAPPAFDCNTSDQQISDPLDLAAMLYNCLGGPHWVNDNNWFTTPSPCSDPNTPWAGIACTSNNTVVGLTFDHWNMKGRFPPRLVMRFPGLLRIKFSNNAIAGTLPTFEFGYAGIAVDFSGNRFEEWVLPFPSTIEIIDLSSNALVSIEPAALVGASGLYELRLDGNQLESLPDAFAGTPGLISLSVTRNQLSGELPVSLLALQNLETVDLSKNRLTGPLPRFASTRLAYFAASDNAFTGDLNSAFVNQDSLQILDVSRNNLTGPVAPSWGSQLRLRSFKINGNELSGSLNWTAWAAIQHLDLFQVNNNNFSGAIPESLCTTSPTGQPPYCNAAGNPWSNCPALKKPCCGIKFDDCQG